MADNNITVENTPVKLTAKDFASDQDVRWCPGCGDYSILAQVQRVMPTLNVKKENLVFVAGIGCSSRFPYYMDTYGFHGIHGRAPAIASGLKIARPDLDVWVAAGDGDLLSIGGNHFIHMLRRNIDTVILLFNNRIYGLTKGQYSPTSEHGQVTKSSPLGAIDHPFNPLTVALGTAGTFVARTTDRDPKHLQEMITRAHAHKGTSFVEVLQNCVIYNDGAWDKYTEKDTKPENAVYLKHGMPLVFGKGNTKGIKLNGFKAEIVSLEDGKHSINDLLVHDETSRELGFMLAEFIDKPGFPVPMGIFYIDDNKTRYEEELEEQIAGATEKRGKGDLEKLLFSGNTWTVE